MNNIINFKKHLFIICSKVSITMILKEIFDQKHQK